MSETELCCACHKPLSEWPNKTDTVQAWIRDDDGWWHFPCWPPSEGRVLTAEITESATRRQLVGYFVSEQ